VLSATLGAPSTLVEPRARILRFGRPATLTERAALSRATPPPVPALVIRLLLLTGLGLLCDTV
jgi:hypothetical protein